MAVFIQGALHARGTETESVRFLPGAADAWAGVRIGGGDSSTFAYARISGRDDPMRMLTRRGRNPSHARPSVIYNDDGGGLVVFDSARASIHHMVLSDNRTPASGGGIAIVDGARAWIEHADIRGNTAYVGGGLHADPATTLRMTHSRIVGNSAALGGSGASLSWSAATSWWEWWEYLSTRSTRPEQLLRRCVVARNHTSQSQGTGGSVLVLANADPDVVIESCTIAGNTGPSAGINVYLSPVTGSGASTDTDSLNLYLRNSIVWRDDGGLGLVLTFPRYQPHSVDYSDVTSPLGHEYNGEGSITADPLFVDATNGDYRLQPASPCIDTGHPAMTDPDGSRIDMGAIPFGQPVAVAEPRAVPTQFALTAAPNPFNPSTTVRFDLPDAGRVRVSVYDVTGRHVRALVDAYTAAGTHAVVWNGADAAGRAVGSGVYLVRLTADANMLHERVTLLR